MSEVGLNWPSGVSDQGTSARTSPAASAAFTSGFLRSFAIERGGRIGSASSAQSARASMALVPALPQRSRPWRCSPDSQERPRRRRRACRQQGPHSASRTPSLPTGGPCDAARDARVGPNTTSLSAWSAGSAAPPEWRSSHSTHRSSAMLSCGCYLMGTPARSSSTRESATAGSALESCWDCCSGSLQLHRKCQAPYTHERFVRRGCSYHRRRELCTVPHKTFVNKLSCRLMLLC